MASITNGEKSLGEPSGLEAVEPFGGLEVAFDSNESESRIHGLPSEDGLFSEEENSGLKILVDPITPSELGYVILYATPEISANNVKHNFGS
jgi:hypothetical protein